MACCWMSLVYLKSLIHKKYYITHSMYLFIVDISVYCLCSASLFEENKIISMITKLSLSKLVSTLNNTHYIVIYFNAPV